MSLWFCQHQAEGDGNGSYDAILRRTCTIMASCFANMFRARHRTFIQHNKWDLPQPNGMEFDQYDTPASRWVACMSDGDVLAGIRLTPTTHRCGIYSYMIRDAATGASGIDPARPAEFRSAGCPQHLGKQSRLRVRMTFPPRPTSGPAAACAMKWSSRPAILGRRRVLGLIPEASRRASHAGSDWTAYPSGPVMDLDGLRVRLRDDSMATQAALKPGSRRL